MGLYGTGRFADLPEVDLERVASADDMASIVEKMLADLEANPSAWENQTLDRFLDALANTGRAYPETMTWRLFAEALVTATGYE